MRGGPAAGPAAAPAEVLEARVGEAERRVHRRLDRFLAERFPGVGRGRIKDLFGRGLVVRAGPGGPAAAGPAAAPGGQGARGGPSGPLRPDRMPAEGTVVRLSVPPPPPSRVEPEDIPLEVLHEDAHLVVVHKPPGMVVHPGAGRRGGTLAAALLHRCPGAREAGEPERPGIVHRLDKGTSGVLVAAKTRRSHALLAALFAGRAVEREYECLLRGVPSPASGSLRSTIGRHPRRRQRMAARVPGGREAVTSYRVLEVLGGVSRCRMRLGTGRTHQIRVHAASLLRAPVLGDGAYGDPARDRAALGDLAGLLDAHGHPFLHAGRLAFDHPVTGERLAFAAPPPEAFQRTLSCLRARFAPGT